METSRLCLRQISDMRRTQRTSPTESESVPASFTNSAVRAMGTNWMIG